MNMKRKKNLIIAFEGLDCSFKETLYNVVKDNFDEIMEEIKEETPEYKKDFILHTESFPRYNKPAASLVNNLLSGKYADVDIYNESRVTNNRPTFNKIARNCFIADFFDYWYHKEGLFMKIEDYEPNQFGDNNCDIDTNHIFLFDRYIFSNAIYNPIMQESLENISMEPEISLGIPAPDFVIWCSHTKFEAMANLITKKKNKDINEMNLNYLKEVWSRTNNFFKEVPSAYLEYAQSNETLSYDIFDNRTHTKYIILEVSDLDGKYRNRNTLSTLAINIIRNIIKEGVLL